MVFWRTLVDILRNPSLLLLHWAMALAMGLLMGAIFFGVGLDISGAQNRAGGTGVHVGAMILRGCARHVGLLMSAVLYGVGWTTGGWGGWGGWGRAALWRKGCVVNCKIWVGTMELLMGEIFYGAGLDISGAQNRAGRAEAHV